MPYNLRKRKATPEVKPPTPTLKRKKAEPKAAPKVAPKAASKIPPKAAPKVAPKVVPKAVPKAASKTEPKTRPRAASKAASKTATKAEPSDEIEKVEDELKLEPEVEQKPKEEENCQEEEDSKVEEPIKKIKLTSRSQLIFGEDTCGELGQGDIGVVKKTPTNVTFKQSISSVVCAPVHTLTLTSDGKVYSYGCNDEGALGRITDGDETLEATPALVPIDGKVVKISAGDSHSAALTSDGKVLIWGNFRDEHGTVGLTPECDGKSSYIPIHMLPEIKFKDIASGSNHMLLLDEQGAVYSFGVGTQGQLGRLTTDEVGEGANSKPITAENRDAFLIPQKVNLKTVDPQRPFICDAIFAGNFSSFATNTDKKKNRLAAWGLNNYFQLGFKGQKGQLVQHAPKRSTFTCSTSMKGVACGPHHTLFMTKTGRVYSAGRNEYGMLGLGKSGGEVCPAKYIETLSGSPIVDISAGINTSFAVSEDGSLFAWGMGGLNLGLKDDKDLMEPTKVESLKGKTVVSVSTGGSFTSVLVESE